MEVVFKEGLLYLQGVKFGKKSWRRTWIVLFQPSQSGIGRVELFDVRDNSSLQTKPPQHRKAERRVIRLCDCLSIVPATVSCPPECTAFSLNTIRRTYTIASEACSEWVSALCLITFQKDLGVPDMRVSQRSEEMPMRDNQLYSVWKTGQYQVTVQTTEASRRCYLAGDYLLSPDRLAILLLDHHTANIIYQWPYQLLRRFGQVKGGFTIEAGRRCPSGEGHFTFLSKHAPQIYRAIEEAIDQQKSLELDTKASPQLPNPSPKPTAFDRHRSDICPLTDSLVRPAVSPQHIRQISLSNTDPEFDGDLYATIEDHRPRLNRSPAPLRMQKSLPTYSLEGEEEGEGEGEERCQSLEAINLDDVKEHHYHNLKRWMWAKVEGKAEDETEKEYSSSECIYALVSKPQPLSPPQPQSQPHPQPQPQPQSQSLYVNMPPQLQTQPQGVEETETGGEARHYSPTVTPTGLHVNFKQKLSDLLCKDLAKLQPPLPSGGGDSPTFYRC